MLEELAQADDIYRVLGTVPPHQQPRCLTPSEDLIQPPPMASSSPITQVADPSNGGGSQPQPWKRKVEGGGGGTISNNNNRFAFGNSSNGRPQNRFGNSNGNGGGGEIKRPITMVSFFWKWAKGFEYKYNVIKIIKNNIINLFFRNLFPQPQGDNTNQFECSSFRTDEIKR